MKHVGAILNKNGVEWWAEGEFIGESDGNNYAGTFHRGAWRPQRDRFSRWILRHWAPKEKEVG